MNNTQ